MDKSVYNLPKWPQMRVAGRKVSPDRALEIIRRTDSIFNGYGGGNGHDWIEWIYKTVGFPYVDYTRDNIDWELAEKQREEFHKRWNYIYTEYVRNDWVSSAYIFGPHGWIHPDGTIYFSENVGKWPSSEALIEDWSAIATAFDDIELDAVFMDREHTEDNPEVIFGVEVRNGKVESFGPSHNFFSEFKWETPTLSFEERMIPIFTDSGFNSETAITPDIIINWAKNNV